MKTKTPSRALLEARLRKLARRLSRTGFMTQGSVFERTKRGSGSRYQWTWKNPNQKTISLTLSAEQFTWLKKAIGNGRSVEQTLEKIRQLSREVVLHHIPGPRRRKPNTIRTLRTI